MEGLHHLHAAVGEAVSTSLFIDDSLSVWFPSSCRLKRSTPAAKRAERMNKTAPVYPGVPIPTRMVTVERTNPVFRASCGKSVMCLYEMSRITMSERIKNVKKSRKKTVLLKSPSPLTVLSDQDVNE